MASTYGNALRFSIFGQSHSPAIGCSLDGVPAGIPVDLDRLQGFLARRAPGEKALEPIEVYGDAGRDAVERAADGGGVRLAEDGEAQRVAVGGSHGRPYSSKSSTSPPSMR